MAMVALIATVPYAYAGRSLVKGDAFEASERDAHILKVVGRAVDAPVRSRVLFSSDLTPESESSDEPKPKRQYRRRDLISEP